MTGQEDERVHIVGGQKFEPIECPHCKKTFWLHIKDGLKKTLESVGNAIGEAMDSR